MTAHDLERSQRSADRVLRIGALAGAAALVGLAARRRTPLALSGATAAAIPLAYRGATGHWPLEPPQGHPVRVKTTMTIRRPAREVYDFWRDFEHLPRFFRHLERVERIDERRSRWTARTPLGPVSWEAEITEDMPGSHIAWRSTEAAPVATHGSVEFEPAPHGRGTVMWIELALEPPAGRVGRLAAGLLQRVTELEIHEDLRRFRSLMEAGEIPTTAGQTHGARARFELKSPF